MEDLVLIDSDGIIFADTETHTIRKVKKKESDPVRVDDDVIAFEVPKEVIIKLPIDLPEDKIGRRKK